MTEEHKKYKQWTGHMEADYVYTSGVAGDRFFKKLRDTGKLSATVCPKCDITYMPPRMYCERCFTELTEWKELDPWGQVGSYTVAHIDEKDKELKEPRVWAFIKIEGANGGLVHNIGEISAEELKTGMKVEAVLKPQNERTGEITDIKWFRPKK